MLQGTGCPRGQLGPQRPAHPPGTDKTEKAQPRIRHQQFRIRVGAHHRLAPLLRQAGLMEQIDQRQAGKRRLRGRLHHHRTPRGHRGHDLVNDQIDRVIEGADRGDQPSRLPVGVRHSVHRGRVQPHGNFPPGQMRNRFDGDPDPVDRPGHLHLGIDERFATLRKRLMNHLFLIGLQEFLEFFKNLNPLGNVQPLGPVGEDRRRLVQPFLDLRAVLHRHFPDFLPIKGVENLQHFHFFTLAPLSCGGQSCVIGLPDSISLP